MILEITNRSMCSQCRLIPSRTWELMLRGSVLFTGSLLYSFVYKVAACRTSRQTATEKWAVTMRGLCSNVPTSPVSIHLSRMQSTPLQCKTPFMLPPMRPLQRSHLRVVAEKVSSYARFLCLWKIIFDGYLFPLSWSRCLVHFSHGGCCWCLLTVYQLISDRLDGDMDYGANCIVSIVVVDYTSVACCALWNLANCQQECCFRLRYEMRAYATFNDSFYVYILALIN